MAQLISWAGVTDALVTVTAVVQPGIKLSGFAGSASAMANPAAGDAIFIPFGASQQVPASIWTSWKQLVGVPCGLLGVVVTGP
jgi:hypothetical protein